MPRIPCHRVRCAIRRRTQLLARLAAGGVALLCVLGLAAYAAILNEERTSPRVVALMYHRFVDDARFSSLPSRERIYSISVKKFEDHLWHLRQAGYQPVTLSQVQAFVQGRDVIPDRAVLITIDDGCRSVLTRAAPLLRRHGMRATLFITTDPGADVFRGDGSPSTAAAERDRLSDAEIASLDPSVFEIGGHGVHHRPLTQLSDAELLAELRDSRDTLTRLTGRPVPYMAVPGNWYDDRVLAAAREAGYQVVCVSDPGTIEIGDNPLRLPRLNVAGTCSAKALLRNISPEAVARRRFAWACLHAPREWLGDYAGRSLRPLVLALQRNGLLRIETPAATLALIVFAWLATAAYRLRRAAVGAITRHVPVRPAGGWPLRQVRPRP